MPLRPLRPRPPRPRPLNPSPLVLQPCPLQVTANSVSREVSLPYSQELPCLCLEVSEGVASTARRGQSDGQALR